MGRKLFQGLFIERFENMERRKSDIGHAERCIMANGNAWAPCIEEKKIDGKYKYFFYYSANPVTNKSKQIGVAIADSPTGPFTDLGRPIVTSSPVGRGQQIDVDVFTDPVSGKSYLYWGTDVYAGAGMNDDMVSIKEETIKVMTPEGGTLQTYAFREAPYISFEKDCIIFFGQLTIRDHPIIM